jgi:thioredoxin-related protein
MSLAAKILASTTSGVLLLVGLVLGARSLQPPAPATGPASALKVTKPRPQWGHDLSRAETEARSGRRLVLINFTGSDWCGWCLRLRRELFMKPEFMSYAETNLVLVEIDFPRDNRQSPGQRAANAAAALRFGVTRVPALVLLDGDGRALRNWGFEDGGARHYLAEFRKAIADSESQAFSPAAGASRPIKAAGASTPRRPSSPEDNIANGASDESLREKPPGRT